MANETFARQRGALEALGDSTRRALFEILSTGPQSVGELAEAVPVSRPAVSQHLRVLKDAGLVADRAEGTRRIYQVRVAGVEDLRSYIESLWESALAGFASAVEEETRTMSTEQTVIKPIKKSVSVDVPVALAFEIFTDRLSEWWPLATHSIGDEATESAHIEGRVGGRVYEIQKDGTEAEWGVVSAWEPPNRFAMEWKVNPKALAPTSIEVRFSEADGGTRVDLEHSHWDRLGPDGAETRSGYDEGWDLVLGSFVAAAGTGAPPTNVRRVQDSQ